MSKQCNFHHACHCNIITANQTVLCRTTALLEKSNVISLSWPALFQTVLLGNVYVQYIEIKDSVHLHILRHVKYNMFVQCSLYTNMFNKLHIHSLYLIWNSRIHYQVSCLHIENHHPYQFPLICEFINHTHCQITMPNQISGEMWEIFLLHQRNEKMAPSDWVALCCVIRCLNDPCYFLYIIVRTFSLYVMKALLVQLWLTCPRDV